MSKGALFTSIAMARDSNLQDCTAEWTRFRPVKSSITNVQEILYPIGELGRAL